VHFKLQFLAAVTAIIPFVVVLAFAVTVILVFLGLVAVVKRLTLPHQAQPKDKPTISSPPKTRIEAESIVTKDELIDHSEERHRLLVQWLDHNERIERYIFTHIAGVTHDNIDGSSRQIALLHCKPMQLLVLKWEQDNPVSKTAIAVYHSETGDQLGYLESRLGRETFNRTRKGEIWSGFIASLGIPSGRDDNILGATIVLVKLRNTKPSENPLDSSVWMKPH
jgi:hypothetical protein